MDFIVEELVGVTHRGMMGLTSLRELVFEGGYWRTPSELYFTRKMSLFPELVFPSSPPSVYPEMKTFPEESILIPDTASMEEVPS